MQEEEEPLQAGQPTAFRTAEKLYKLPPPAQGRRRKKLRCAGVGVPAKAPQPLDFRLPEQIKQLVVYSTDDRLGSLQSIYGLRTHPGLFFLPSSVPPSAQHAFLEDIAGQLLDPPAATNLTAVHGPLPGLWRAAAEGLRLREASGRQPSAGAEAAPRAGSSHAPAAAASSMQRSAPQAACASQDVPPSAHAEASPTPAAGTPDCSPVWFDAVWCAGGGGATAAALLRKLRWLTVGPRYDWTDRVYDFKGPYHTLPVYAAALARDLVAATQQAVQSAPQQQPRQTPAGTVGGTAPDAAPAEAPRRCAVATGYEPVRACQPNDMHSSGALVTEQQQQPPASSPAQPAPQKHQPAPTTTQHIACLHHNGAGHGIQQPAAPAQPSLHSLPQAATGNAAEAFSPDAALVCFYHAGDTLCGHRDDVEQDLSQPIVSLSLGCTAVLLVGGLSRDEPPTPLLVRHGDAVIFTGVARMYYHGVPRVFDDGPGDPEPDSISSLSPELRAFLRHIRINISIRSVS